MTTTVQDINKILQEEAAQEDKLVADLVFSNLLPTGPAGFLPESLFVQFFLPRFIGQVKIENDDWVTRWISITGSAMAEVGIFKDGTKDVLFVVPGLFHTQGMTAEQTDGSFNDIDAHRKRLALNSPREATRFFVESLMHKRDQYVSGADLTAPERAWVHILERYNLIPPSGQSSDRVTAATENDFFVFE